MAKDNPSSQNRHPSKEKIQGRGCPWPTFGYTPDEIYKSIHNSSRPKEQTSSVNCFNEVSVSTDEHP